MFNKVNRLYKLFKEKYVCYKVKINKSNFISNTCFYFMFFNDLITSKLKNYII